MVTAEQIREANERLAALDGEGFKVNNAIAPRLQKRPELIVWVASSRADARALHDAAHSERRSLAEVDRIERNFDNRQPFRTELPAPSDTDAQLRQRKRDIRDGLRWR